MAESNVGISTPQDTERSQDVVERVGSLPSFDPYRTQIAVDPGFYCLVAESERDELLTTIASLRQEVERLTKENTNFTAPDGSVWHRPSASEYYCKAQWATMNRQYAIDAKARASRLERALVDLNQELDQFWMSKRTDKDMARVCEKQADCQKALRSLPVNAGSTSSDGGVEGHARSATNAGSEPHRAASGTERTEAPLAGIKPGPSETLSPDTARVADREATITFARWWVQDVSDKLNAHTTLPTGSLGDQIFLLREMLKEKLLDKGGATPDGATPDGGRQG